MKRHQIKKRRIHAASVRQTPNPEVALNDNSHQSVPSSIRRGSHHPLEVASWLAGIVLCSATLIGLPSIIGWLSPSRDQEATAKSPIIQQPNTVTKQESNAPGATTTPKPFAAQSSTSTNNLQGVPSLGPNTTAIPANFSKPGNETLVTAHLARAKSLKRQHKYSEALTEVDKALQIDRGNKRAQALAAEIILAENDKPKQ